MTQEVHFSRSATNPEILCGASLVGSYWTYREIDMTCPKCMKIWEAIVQKNEKVLQELAEIDEIRADLLCVFPKADGGIADELAEWAWKKIKEAVTDESRKMIAALCEHCADDIPLEHVLIGKDKVDLWVHLFEDGRWVCCEAYKLRQFLSTKEEA